MIVIPEGTKAILFDLGGVLLNLNLQKCFDAFEKLGFQNFNQHFDSYSGSPFIEDFEEGKISTEDFIHTIQKYCAKGTTTHQILDAWNAMLGEVPHEKFEQLMQWKKNYNLLLYSNTNALHVAFLHQYYDNTFGKNVFQQCFSKIYYSQEIGIRKPKKEGYQLIMQEQHLVAHEIFYIEDGKQHVATAKELGINTLHWTPNAPF